MILDQRAKTMNYHDTERSSKNTNRTNRTSPSNSCEPQRTFSNEGCAEYDQAQKHYVKQDKQLCGIYLRKKQKILIYQVNKIN